MILKNKAFLSISTILLVGIAVFVFNSEMNKSPQESTSDLTKNKQKPNLNTGKVSSTRHDDMSEKCGTSATNKCPENKLESKAPTHQYSPIVPNTDPQVVLQESILARATRLSDVLGLDSEQKSSFNKLVMDYLNSNQLVDSKISSVIFDKQELFSELQVDPLKESPDHQELRDLLSTMAEEATEKKEASRVMFEDEMRNTLPQSKIEKLKNIEKQLVVSAQNDFVKEVHDQMVRNLPDLSDSQKKQFAYVVEKYTNFESRDIPLGSTVRIQDGYMLLGDSGAVKFLTNVQMDFDEYLTSEQKNSYYQAIATQSNETLFEQ